LAYGAFGASAAQGAITPAASDVSARHYMDRGLDIQTELISGLDLDKDRTADLDALLIPVDRAFLDAKTGRWATLIPTQPLVPGDGRTNQLKWSDLQLPVPNGEVEMAAAVEIAFRDYVQEFAPELGLASQEFADKLNVTEIDGSFVVHVPRVVGGIPVRNAFLTATINHGNLVLLGAARWADVTVDLNPTFDSEKAREWLAPHIAGLPETKDWADPALELIPYDEGATLSYRLAWSLKPGFEKEIGQWEALIDAHSGDLLSFLDTNHYATRHVVGGVYPISNDGSGPSGSEQSGWPMPFANIDSAIGDRFTDANGNFFGEYDGEVTTNLNGLYVRISDNCGSVSESSTGDADINLGTSGGTDCTTAGGGSAGNTHSSRTAFYELNRIAEWGRNRWPGNGFMKSQLLSNMNIDATCNAFWNGTVNFYKSGGGCRNTGELAGVIDHEWGHGLDNNDNIPAVSFPGEGIADIYAALRLNDSCIGRGFYQSGNCGGYGDPCTSCSGLRDIDYARRASGTPHTPTWAASNCGGCGFGGGVHCQGAVYAEAVWDLAKRDLQAQYGADDVLALELATRITFAGAINVGTWFTCGGDGEDGCSGEGGYLNYLAADDIDGDLSNGTPHMDAIYNAFNRHGIACSSPTVQSLGCENAPSESVVINASRGEDGSATLRWDPMPGVGKFYVFRTEGTKECNKGRVLVGTTNDTQFTDTDLLNGFDYYYTVATAFGGRRCGSPMTNCTKITPTAGD